jgi:osmotically-inducible protein OsmY
MKPTCNPSSHTPGALACALALLLVLAGCGQDGSATGEAGSSRVTQDAGNAPAALGDADNTVGDAALEAMVRTALVGKPGLHALSVEATDGVITLAGRVDSRASRDELERSVLKLDGVQAVRNELEVDANR